MELRKIRQRDALAAEARYVHDGATDPLGGALGLVHGYKAKQNTSSAWIITERARRSSPARAADTETGEDAANDERGDVGCASLASNANAEEDEEGDDAEAAAEEVTNGRAKESCAMC